MPVAGVPKAQAQHFELALLRATGLHLSANQRTDLHERNMPEEAKHMTTTPEQIEAVARAMWLSQYPSLGWILDANSTAKIEFRVLASAAIDTMRPFIRDEVLEEAADVVGEVGDCAEAGAYITAIRALKEKP
jgi:hypothetical protein